MKHREAVNVNFGPFEAAFAEDQRQNLRYRCLENGSRWRVYISSVSGAREVQLASKLISRALISPGALKRVTGFSEK